MSLLREILKANQSYALNEFPAAGFPAIPVKKCAFLTCMDARLDPAKIAGFSEGDAHVIRNAGGRASDDAIRSLIISSKLYGTTDWFVIHHTFCGMATFTGEIMTRLLRQSLEPARHGSGGWVNTGQGPGTAEGEFVSWLTFENLEASVLEDLIRIRTNPMVPASIRLHGLIYDCATGKLSEVKCPRTTAPRRKARQSQGPNRVHET